MSYCTLEQAEPCLGNPRAIFTWKDFGRGIGVLGCELPKNVYLRGGEVGGRMWNFNLIVKVAPKKVCTKDVNIGSEI